MAQVTVTNNGYSIESLYKWDTGQELEIYGMTLPVAPQVHFAHKGAQYAIVRQASMDASGVIRASIPDIMLQSTARLYAYICIEQGAEFKTLCKIAIPVISRAKPNDYTSDEETYVYALANVDMEILTLEPSKDAKVEKVMDGDSVVLRFCIPRAPTVAEVQAGVIRETLDEANAAARSATRDAQTAATAAGTAAQAANAAGTSERNAAQSAQSAGNAQTAAAGSAQAAAAAKNAAEAAKDAAEQAKNEAQAIAGGNFLPLAGGKMTGPIALAGNPTEGLHAAPKQYVDDALGYVETELAEINGGTEGDDPTSGDTGGGMSYKIGHGLKVEGNTLMVNSVLDFEGDNSLPAAASLVQSTVGNIEILLATI